MKVLGDDLKRALADGFTKLTDATSEASYLQHCDPEISKEYATLKLQATLKRLREEEKAEKQNRPKKNRIDGTSATNAVVFSDSDSD